MVSARCNQSMLPPGPIASRWPHCACLWVTMLGGGGGGGGAAETQNGFSRLPISSGTVSEPAPRHIGFQSVRQRSWPMWLRQAPCGATLGANCWAFVVPHAMASSIVGVTNAQPQKSVVMYASQKSQKLRQACAPPSECESLAIWHNTSMQAGMHTYRHTTRRR